jgi:hypothetical protein
VIPCVHEPRDLSSARRERDHQAICCGRHNVRKADDPRLTLSRKVSWFLLLVNGVPSLNIVVPAMFVTSDVTSSRP